MASNGAGIGGLNVRQTGTALLFERFLQNSGGGLLTTGTTTYRLFEVQVDGAIRDYDFATNTFKGSRTTSVTAVTVGTGNKAFTLPDQNRGYAAGDTVLCSSSGSSATMQGAFVSYLGGVLTINVSTTAGSGSHSDWIVTEVLTTKTANMNYQRHSNGDDSGYWTAALTTLTGFTVRNQYRVHIYNQNLLPTDQMFGFQYGGAEGDLLTYDFATGQSYLKTDNIFTQQVADNAQSGDASAVVHDGTFGNAALLAAIVASGGSGGGAYAWTVKVTSDGTTPIAGAVVRVSGAQSGLLVSNGSGLAVFSLNAGAVTLSATAAGYYYGATVQTVSGVATVTITMTANPVVNPSSDAAKSNVYFTVRDSSLAKVVGATFRFTLINPKGATDAYNTSLVQTAISDVNGLVQIQLGIGMIFLLEGPGDQTLQFTVGTGTTTALPNQFLDKF